MSPLRVVGTALVAAVALVACAGGGPPGKAPVEPVVAPALSERVTLEPVALPAAWRDDSPSAGSWSVVAGSGDLPRTAVTTDGTVRVWTAAGAGTFGDPVALDVEAALSAALATDGTTTAVAGQAYRDGLRRGYLAVSSDRSTWRPVALDEDAAAVAATHVAVVPGTVPAGGAAPEDRAPGTADRTAPPDDAAPDHRSAAEPDRTTRPDGAAPAHRSPADPDRTAPPDSAAPEDPAPGTADPTILLAGAGPDGRSPAVVVHGPAGASVTGLPEPPPGHTTRVLGLAADGDHAVVVTETGPRGQPAAPTAHTSTDGAATFSAHPLGEARDDVAGVVAGADGFVATGSRHREGYTRPAAWSSPDGARWRADDARMPTWAADPTGGSRTTVDHWFGAPVHDPASGRVTAAVVQRGAAHVFAAERDSSGTWETALRTGPLGHSAHGVAYRAGDELRALATFTGGSAAEAAAGPDPVGLVDHDGGYALDQAVDLGGSLGLLGTRESFAVSADGDRWRSGRETAPAVLDDDGTVAARDWLPQELPAGAEPVVARDPRSGTTVALAVLPDADGTFPAAGWVRPEGGDWSAVTGLEPGVYQYPTTLRHTAEGWYAAVQVADSPSLSQTRRVAEVWRSVDGVDWTRPSGSLGLEGGQDSRVADVCAGTAGTLAVGWATDADGRSNAAAWRGDGDRVPAVLDTDRGSWFESCFTTADGELRVTGQAGSSVVWALAGEELVIADELGPGLRRGAVTEVDGGFAAGGFEESAEHYGPLLWLSADGEEWEPVRVPVDGLPAEVDVAPFGGDLLVVVAGAAQAHLLRDVATLLTP